MNSPARQVDYSGAGRACSFRVPNLSERAPVSASSLYLLSVSLANQRGAQAGVLGSRPPRSRSSRASGCSCTRQMNADWLSAWLRCATLLPSGDHVAQSSRVIDWLSGCRPSPSIATTKTSRSVSPSSEDALKTIRVLSWGTRRRQPGAELGHRVSRAFY